MKITKTFIIIIFLPIIFANASTKDRLQHVKEQIISTKSEIHHSLVRKDALQNELQKNEISANELSLEISRTTSAYRQQQTILLDLKKKDEDLNLQLEQQKQLFFKQIRASYLLSRTPYIKLLLDKHDTSEMSRTLIYYQQLSKQQQLLIKNLQNSLDEIQQNKIAVEHQSEILNQLEVTKKKQRNQIQTLNNDRRQVIKQINVTLATKNQKLTKLLQDKKHFENMLADLQKKTKTSIVYSGGKFAKLRRHLPWPIKGPLLARFGSTIDHSELTWNGVLIKADKGQPVHAIADGKVIFSKWFSGYGLLIIIYHGNGYMSLYGRNTSLYKKEGDLIHQNDVISSVGESGGFDRPALYFAIRYNSEPVNPLLWCVER